jgi:microcystin-dependent protein
MLKRLLLLAGLLSLVSGPAMAAGTIPGISMTQQLDSLGRPLNGGRLYLIQAGTTSTPQNCYQDSGLTIPWPNPITLDSAGRIPQLFCADGSIKIRLTNAAGVQQLVADNLLVVGPSGGGGGGGTVDPTTILATGDIKYVFGTDTLTGFVRCNGKTIGSATSGGTERANADTSALFSFLWGGGANLTVSGGKGASAAADFAANKTIALPDCRGRVIAGLDDIGGSAFRLTATGLGVAADVLGNAGGSETYTLVTSNLPPYTPSGLISGIGNSSESIFQRNSGSITVSTGGANTVPSFSNSSVSINGSQYGFTGSAQGGSSAPFSRVQPTILMTPYIKL